MSPSCSQRPRNCARLDGRIRLFAPVELRMKYEATDCWSGSIHDVYLRIPAFCKCLRSSQRIERAESWRASAATRASFCVFDRIGW